MAGMPYPPNLCASVSICGRLSLPEGSVCSVYSVGHSICLLCWCCRGSCTSVVVFFHGFHGFPQKLGCVIGGVGMAGMPYPPNLCTSVQSVGGTSLPECSVCSAYSVGHSLPVCLVMSVVVFSHGIHRMLGCVVGGVGMAGCHTLLICVHLCLSVGGFLCQTVLCVPRVLWDTLPICFVGAVLALASGKAERRLLHQRGSILPRISRISTDG